MNSQTRPVRLGPRGTMLSTCLCFFALGMALSALGPALPELAAQSGSPLASLGGLFSALFLGALIAQLAAGPLGDRFDQRAILLAGIALFALGTLGYLVSQALPLMLICSAIAGLGQGALVISNNTLIARVFAGRSTAALNLSNVFFGAGDVAGPALASLVLRVWAAATPALWFSVALLLLSAALVPFVMTPQRQPFSYERAEGRPPIYRAPILWALSALVLLYVGNEISLSGWTAIYIQRTTTLDAVMAALVTAGFWLGITLGRVIGALLGARLAANELLELCLGGAVLGGLLLAASVGHAPLTIAATLWLGLCFGPVYPTAIALVADRFREQPGTAISIVSALGSLGGMLIPWLQGNLLARSGPPASALLIAAGTLAMLALHAGRRLYRTVETRIGKDI